MNAKLTNQFFFFTLGSQNREQKRMHYKLTNFKKAVYLYVRAKMHEATSDRFPMALRLITVYCISNFCCA